MFRALLYGLAILHLGPGIAFAVLAFGCGEPEPLLGAVCDQDQLRSFLCITLASWVLLSCVFALYARLTRLAPAPGRGPDL